MDWVPLNFSLLKNPVNWFIVLFMVSLALVPVALVSEVVTGKTLLNK